MRKNKIKTIITGILLSLTLSTNVWASEIQEITQEEAQKQTTNYIDESYSAYQNAMQQETTPQANIINSDQNLNQNTMIDENHISADGQKTVNINESRWDGVRNKNNPFFQRPVQISMDTIKIEVIYSNDAVLNPEIVFRSPTGETYKAVEANKIDNNGFIFETRKSGQLTNFPDLCATVIYISGTKDPGAWTMQVTFDEAVREFFVITAKPDPNWQTLKVDYLTEPTDIIQWAIMDSSNSKHESMYTINDIANIIMAEKNPDINYIAPESNKIDENEVDWVMIILVSCIVAIIIGVAIWYYIHQRMDKEKKENKLKSIFSVNERLRAKKNKENDELDKYLDDNDLLDDEIDEDLLGDAEISDFENEEENPYDIKETEKTVAPWDVDAEEDDKEEIEKVSFEENSHNDKDASEEETEESGWEDDDFFDEETQKESFDIEEDNYEKNEEQSEIESIEEFIGSEIISSSKPQNSDNNHHSSNKEKKEKVKTPNNLYSKGAEKPLWATSNEEKTNNDSFF